VGTQGPSIDKPLMEPTQGQESVQAQPNTCELDALKAQGPFPVTMDEPVKKAFDFASDATKQLITLSTAIIAFTVTFSKEILRNTAGEPNQAALVSHGGKILLVIAWSLYLFSIICGIWTLYALTGTLEQKALKKVDISTRGPNVTVPSIGQIILFMLATGLIVAFGITSIW
jgi:hypothetical protein